MGIKNNKIIQTSKLVYDGVEASKMLKFNLSNKTFSRDKEITCDFIKLLVLWAGQYPFLFSCLDLGSFLKHQISFMYLIALRSVELWQS